MTPPKHHAWKTRLGEQVAHAVRHAQRDAICELASASLWQNAPQSAERCPACLDLTRRHSNSTTLPPNTRPNVEGSRIIGGERRDVLDALVLSNPSGGMLSSVLDDDTKAWLRRHRLAVEHPAGTPRGPRMKWRITPAGRTAAERGFY